MVNTFTYKLHFEKIFIFALKEAACIWFVLALAVALNGAGYVRPNGQEIVWELIGSVKDFKFWSSHDNAIYDDSLYIL